MNEIHIRDITIDEFLSQGERIDKYVIEGNTFYGSDKWNIPRYCGWCKKELTFKHPAYIHFLTGEFRRCNTCKKEYCASCTSTYNLEVYTGGMTARHELSSCVLCEKAWMFKYSNDMLLRKALEKLECSKEQLAEQISEDFLKDQAMLLQKVFLNSVGKKIPVSLLKIVVRLRDDTYNRHNTKLLEYIGIK